MANRRRFLHYSLRTLMVLFVLVSAAFAWLGMKINQVNIGDEGIKHLSRIESLEVLNIGMTGVTDAAIPALLKMTNLKGLDKWRTNISAEGAKRLKDGLPDCDVRF